MLKGTVRTAFALTPEEKRSIERRFFEILGDAVSLEEQVDERLLAGVSVEVDGRVYDGSLRARLAQVERILENDKEEAGGNA